MFLLIRGPRVLRTSGGSNCALNPGFLVDGGRSPLMSRFGEVWEGPRGRETQALKVEVAWEVEGNGQGGFNLVGKREGERNGGVCASLGWRCTSTLYKYFSSLVTSDARDFLARGAEEAANRTHEHSPLSARGQGGKSQPRGSIG